MDERLYPDHQEIRRSLIRRSDAVILVYDITSRSSLEVVKLHHRQVMQVLYDQASALDIPVHLVGNKLDLIIERGVSRSHTMAAAEGLGCVYSEICCEDGDQR